MGNFLKWISNMFNGRGTISSKRVTGCWLILLVSFCILWIMFHEGGTDNVESLLEACLIIAASLLGLSSVTGIFKSKNSKNKASHENQSEELNE